MATHYVLIAVALFFGCGGGDDDAPPPASEDWTRDLLHTDLALDLTARSGRAAIEIAAADGATGASFEVGDLSVARVTGPDEVALDFRVHDGHLDVGVPDTGDSVTIAVEYEFQDHTEFDGWMSGQGVSFLWPYFCGNFYPCKSDPAEGLTFSMSVSGVPGGMTAVYPAAIPDDAPSYMPAVAVGDFTEVELGTTPGGVDLVVWHLPDQDASAAAGTEHLVDVMTFYEDTYGAYRFGDRAGTVSADWGGGDFGGMEHHPFWHVSSGSLYSEDVNAHEAAHGWFGNSVRIACWEDFVLSEGTVSYMAARALSESGVDIWSGYCDELAGYCAGGGNTIALPSTCDEIDILNDPLWSGVPYMKGAVFLAEVALVIGEDTVDTVLADFYAAHAGSSARMDDLIAALAAAGDSATVNDLADSWLRTLSCPTSTVCP